MNGALVRVRGHWNSRVKVRDLADTEGPVTESNCIGAIPPGGEQLEVNHQSVTPSVRRGGQSELDSVGGFGELASARRSPNKIERPALREWSASGREPRMVGDRMVGGYGDGNQGSTAGDDERACRGQSVRSRQEAGNDRGAKGRRKVVLGAELRPSHQGRRSAARLCASVRRRTAWPRLASRQWAARNWVSGSARTARLACFLRTSRNNRLSQPIGGCRPESRMREIRPSGLGGRGSALRSSYPHRLPSPVTAQLSSEETSNLSKNLPSNSRPKAASPARIAAAVNDAAGKASTSKLTSLVSKKTSPKPAAAGMRAITKTASWPNRKISRWPVASMPWGPSFPV